MLQNKVFHSKWFLAALLILGLIYFEGRMHQRLIGSNREPAATSSTP